MCPKQTKGVQFHDLYVSSWEHNELTAINPIAPTQKFNLDSRDLRLEIFELLRAENHCGCQKPDKLCLLVRERNHLVSKELLPNLLRRNAFKFMEYA
jgi:hypothetical protein